MNTPLRHLVETRLNDDDKVDDDWGLLVLAALAGSEALERELGQQATEPRDAPTQPDDAPTTGARGAFLQSIAVEGFRGIGPKATLDIPPGPGLTLVVGRNGSGKSSFAEGLEVLLTGDSRRWDQRSAVWREGWRNLHHKTHAVEAQIILEGQASPCRAWREWADADDFDAPVTNAQVHGKPKGLLEDLGWTEALQSHRPFLMPPLASLIRDWASELRVPLWAGAVLTRGRSSGQRVAEELAVSGIPAKWVESKDLNLEAKHLKVMTVHAAKGLEFPFVAVANVAERSFPSTFRQNQDEDDRAEWLAQERRLFHVALTRAMRRLAVCYPDDRPSEFVADLDRQLWDWRTV